MKLEDKKTVHEHLLLNLDGQKEMIDNITRFNKMLELKRTDSMGAGVQSWSISELETRINEFKDLLHGYETVYKELLQTLVN